MAAMAYVLISARNEKKVAKKLMDQDIVTEVHELFGQWDVLVKLESKEMANIQDFITNTIRQDGEVQGTETLIVSDVF